jgi:hypothetical protein
MPDRLDNRGGNGASRLYDPKMKLKKGGMLSKSAEKGGVLRKSRKTRVTRMRKDMEFVSSNENS